MINNNWFSWGLGTTAVSLTLSLVSFPVQSQTIYWTDNRQDAIYSANIDGSNPTLLIDLEAEFAPSMDQTIDTNNTITNNGDFLFWSSTIIANDLPLSEAIYRSAIDGSNPLKLIEVPNEPLGMIAYENSIFWTDSGQDVIYQANIDGSNSSVLVDLDTVFGPGDYGPAAITTDGTSIFWADFNSPSIYQVGIDGSNPIVLADIPSLPDTIPLSGGALTTDGTSLFGTGVLFTPEPPSSTGILYSVGVDGSNPTILLTGGVGSIDEDMAVDGEFLFFAGGSGISRSDIDGSNFGFLVAPTEPGSYQSRSLTIVQQQPPSVPEPTMILGLLTVSGMGVLARVQKF